MNEILKMLNNLTADELDSLILRANILLDKKRKDEAEQARLEQERLRQEKIVQEKRRQEEIAKLQRQLEELQRQGSYAEEKPSAQPRAAASAQPAQSKSYQMVTCPHCRKMNPSGSAFCSGCGKNMKEKPAEAQTIACPHCGHKNSAGSAFCANCGQSMTAKAAPLPAQTAAPQTTACPHCGHRNPAGSAFCEGCGQKMTAAKAAAQPAPAARPATAVSGISYADENMKEWTRLPGEKTEWGKHDANLVTNDTGKKYKYYIEITNMRILFTRESAAAANAGLAARMGAGLVGSLVANGIKSMTNSVPKPYMAIRLSAITNVGIEGKKDTFIEAGERVLIKNHRYDSLLLPLIEKAKQNGY